MDQQLTGFSELYRRYAGDVFRFAYWLCGDRDRAQDIVSDTFMKVWLTPKDIRLQTVKGFLFTIARNEFLKGLRRKKKQTELPEEIMDSGLSADTHIEATETLRRTVRHLRQLPEADRTAFILHVLEDIPQQEVAVILNISYPALKVKIFRARRKLLALSLENE